MKSQDSFARKILPHIHESVVALGNQQNRGKCNFLHALLKRADASSMLQLTQHWISVNGFRTHLLAEQLYVLEIIGAGPPTRWRIIRIVRHQYSYFFAVHVPAWSQRPAFPELDLSERERKLVYTLCDELSDREAYLEYRCDLSTFILRDMNRHIRKVEQLGELQVETLAELMRKEPFALCALKSALLAGLWSFLPEKCKPNFVLHFVMPKHASPMLARTFFTYFKAVDLLCSRTGAWDAPIRISLHSKQDLNRLAEICGRLALLCIDASSLRDALISELQARHTARLLGAKPSPLFYAMPLTTSCNALPETVAWNVEVCNELHPLSDVEFIALRQAAALLLLHLPEHAAWCKAQFKLARQSAYSSAQTQQDFWRKLIHTLIQKELPSFISTEAKQQQEEAERHRLIEAGADFLCSPARYQKVISSKPSNAEEYERTVAFVYQDSIAINPKFLPELLAQVEVPAEWKDAVISVLKNRSIIKHTTTPVNCMFAIKRYLLIPLKKCENYSITGVTAITGNQGGDPNE